MGKKGHLTFEKGHLIFVGGCVRIPRTSSDTPLSIHKYTCVFDFDKYTCVYDFGYLYHPTLDFSSVSTVVFVHVFVCWGNEHTEISALNIMKVYFSFI